MTTVHPGSVRVANVAVERALRLRRLASTAARSPAVPGTGCMSGKADDPRPEIIGPGDGPAVGSDDELLEERATELDRL